MQKSLFLLFSVLFLFSCVNSDVTPRRIQGQWKLQTIRVNQETSQGAVNNSLNLEEENLTITFGENGAFAFDVQDEFVALPGLDAEVGIDGFLLEDNLLILTSSGKEVIRLKIGLTDEVLVLLFDKELLEQLLLQQYQDSGLASEEIAQLIQEALEEVIRLNIEYRYTKL